jgi:hypothetical protein
MANSQKLYKNDLRWSVAAAGAGFAMLFGWMLYYAATATENTNVHPHLLGMPVFRVQAIDKGFEIGPEYGIVLLPLVFGALVFGSSLVFRYASRNLTHNLPE